MSSTYAVSERLGSDHSKASAISGVEKRDKPAAPPGRPPPGVSTGTTPELHVARVGFTSGGKKKNARRVFVLRHII